MGRPFRLPAGREGSPRRRPDLLSALSRRRDRPDALAAPAGGRARPGLLEVDANANPLREGLLQNLMTVTDGCVSLPGGQGLGLEPDLKPLANLRSLHIERRA